MTTDDAVEISPATPDRRHRRRIAVGIVLVVLIAGGVIAWRATRGADDVPVARPPWTGSAVACPATVDHPVADGGASSTPTLPAAPARPGLDQRLVPAEAPRAVTLCEFDAPPGTVLGDPAAAAAGLPLTRTAEFEEGDDAFTGLVTSLQDAPVPGEGFYICAGWVVGNGAAPDHLIGLTYEDGGVVWLAVGPADCSGTENAEFHSDLDVRERVIAMLAAAPPASDPDEPCVAVGSPRPGTADRYVPFTPTSVLVCHAGPDSPDRWTSRRGQPADVAVLLRRALVDVPAVPADPAVATCVGVPVDRWALLFTGAGGAQELVLVDGGACRTANNGWRDGQVDDGFLALLDQVD